jgi:hypothetical protein
MRAGLKARTYISRTLDRTLNLGPNAEPWTER